MSSQPPTQGQLAAARFKPFSHETLAALVCPQSAPLSAEVFQTPDRISLADAKRATYKPVQLGWHWGPPWSTAWFRIRGTVPASMKGQRVCVNFSTGTEALIWRDDTPYHGLDANRSTAVLFPDANGNERVDLYIEAACNHVLGITDQLFWEPPEQQARWREPTPGRFETCQLVTVNQDAWRLMRTFEFARLLLEQTPDDSPRLTQLSQALEAVSNRPASDLAGSIAFLESALSNSGAPGPPSCWTVGHAHLDTAWLWPVAETKRKALRTFANSLRLMERFPDYHFLCTQPQQYQWVKEQSPQLFEQIRARVKEGRWEPLGAFWVEPDGNLPSGESFIRQILHANKFWRENFPDLPPQRLAYLPDTFGFAASLPQIFRLAGLDTFITNKLWWNETNEFPHTHFRWRGIDGTDILSHLTPGQEYNATNTPFELFRGQRIAARKDPHKFPWLQPFGFGDGGGGPTDWTILYSQLPANTTDLPATTSRGAADFCDELHRRVAELASRGTPLPTYEGELYLERHRGTYTTQARVKKDNASAECNLFTAAWLTFAGPTPLPDADKASALLRLDNAWKLALLNQFHDILPGSSIGEVYQDAVRDHAAIHKTCVALRSEAVQHWAAAADTRGLTNPVMVLNPTSHAASGLVEIPDARGELMYFLAKNVPAMGFKVIQSPFAAYETRRDQWTLDNGIVRATINADGCIASLCRAGCPEVAGTPLNRLAIYRDHPKHWDAWDIDKEYLPSEIDMPPPSITTAGSQVHLSHYLGHARRINLTYSLPSERPYLRVDAFISWHESHTLLRALFPTNIRAPLATYEIPFGHIHRPTTRDDPIDKAKFEVPAHRWMDLSEPAARGKPGRGLAILNDCKYGHSCHGSVMGLSLLRSPKWPDPEADIGTHTFTYSLMPHAGDWRAAGVDREAELMTRPMWAVPLTPGRQGTLGNSWAPFSISGTAAIRIAAIKPPESGEANKLILRLVENHGRPGRCHIDWALPVAAAESVNLLERPLPFPISHNPDTRSTTLTFKPFQIITLALTLAR
jgi:alpha-mannosidase